MAFVNFSDLKASIEVWSKREDVKALIPDFIAFAENQIYSNTTEPLRIRSMVKTATDVTSVSVRTQALPSDYLEIRRYDFDISNQRRTIDYLTPAHMNISSGTGTPSNYTITSQIEYNIQPDEAYATNLTYYGKLTALSDANPTNDILTNHADIYLYGSLMTLFQYAEDDEQSIKYQNLFFQAIHGSNSVDSAGNIGVATQKQRRGRNP
jgi:hypothetical protein